MLILSCILLYLVFMTILTRIVNKKDKNPLAVFSVLTATGLVLFFLNSDYKTYDYHTIEHIEVFINEIPPAQGRFIRIIEEPGAEKGFLFRYYIDGVSSEVESSNITPDFSRNSEVTAYRQIKINEKSIWSVGLGARDEIYVRVPMRIAN